MVLMGFGFQCPWNESTLLAFLIRHLPASGDSDNSRMAAGRSQLQPKLPRRGEHLCWSTGYQGLWGLAGSCQFWPEALLAFLQLQKAQCFLSCLVVTVVSARFSLWPLRNHPWAPSRGSFFDLLHFAPVLPI